MSAKKPNPVFGALSKLSSHDLQWVKENWNDKALAPYVLQRWLSGTTSARQIVVLNEIANRHVFGLSQHKELVLQLFAVSTDGQQYRYKWNRPAPQKFPNTVALITKAIGCSRQEALEHMTVLSDSDIMDMTMILGVQDDDVKKIRKELTTR